MDSVVIVIAIVGGLITILSPFVYFISKISNISTRLEIAEKNITALWDVVNRKN